MLLGEDFTTIDNQTGKEQIVIRPILDDRMFVICWYGNDKEIKKLQYNAKLEEYQYLNHEKNDFWTQYIFVDNSGNTIQSRELRRILTKKHTYDRWIDSKTLYGISRYSLTALTSTESFAKDVLSRHVAGRYYELTLIALAQRASIIKFSDEATLIAGSADSLITAQAEFLHKTYMQFINRMNFSEVTAQEQGIEMYQMLIDSMQIDRDTNNLNREIDELHQYLNTKEQDKATKEALWLNILATIFLPATFVVSFLGMNPLPTEALRLCFNKPLDRAALVYSAIVVLFLLGPTLYYRKAILERVKNRNKIKRDV